MEHNYYLYLTDIFAIFLKTLYWQTSNFIIVKHPIFFHIFIRDFKWLNAFLWYMDRTVIANEYIIYII